MKRMHVKPEDEYEHSPLEDPSWREGYYFSGYDPEKRIGVSIIAGIRPHMGIKEEIVTIHGENPLLFLSVNQVAKDPFASGLQMEPLELLKKWRIYVRDSFQKIENGIPSGESREVECSLQFESDVPPFGYSTERGDRYEQPGFLRGEITIDGDTFTFNGKGIRDRSWEIRHISSWGEWYAFMGSVKSGFVSFGSITIGENQFCQGWVRMDKYSEIGSVQIDPVFSGGILERSSITIETSEDTVKMSTRLISFVKISLGEEQEKSEIMETLVNLQEGGHGILWYWR